MAQDSIGRNQVFPIYNADETPFHGLVIRKSSVESAIMSLGDKISGDVYYADNSLAFTMQEYIVYNGVKYVLVSPPTVVREGKVSDNGELKGMTKYSLTFYHPMYMLGNFPFTDIAVTQEESKYLSQSKTFAWIGNLFDFVAKLNANLAGTDWIVAANIVHYEQDGTTVTSEWSKAKKISDVLSFDKQFVADALKTAFDTWEIPFTIVKTNITGKKFLVEFGLPSQEIYGQDGVTPFIFQFGQGVGLSNNSRTPKNNKIITRLAGEGTERNIPYGYPQIIWTGNQDWDYTINNASGMQSITVRGETIQAMSYPIYDGIVGGQKVRLIKHPFTRKTLMPSIYAETVNLKVNPNATGYKPDTVIVDYYDATEEEDYPNPINLSAPSFENHQFEDIYPRLGDVALVGVYPYDERTFISISEFNTLVGSKIDQSDIEYEKGILRALIQTIEEATSSFNSSHEDTNYSYSVNAKATVYEYGIWFDVDYTSDNANFRCNVYRGTYSPRDSVDWDDTMDDDGKYLQEYFKIRLPQLSFDVYASASITESMEINMRSGACLGCTFQIQVDWDDYKRNFFDADGNFDPVIGTGHPRDGEKYPDSSQGQIDVVVQKDINTFGTLMPNEYQQPASGDKFVILGISLPLTYITAAEEELDDAMKAYMLENNVHYYDYQLKFDEYFLATHTEILSQIKNNSIVRFKYAGTDVALYVKQITVKYNEGVLPKYDIVLTDDIEVVLSKIGQVVDDVDKLSYIVSAMRQSSSTNELKDLKDINTKLSRVQEDTAKGKITFADGVKFGTSQSAHGIEKNGDADLHHIATDGNVTIGNYNRSTPTHTGAKITNGGNGDFVGVTTENLAVTKEAHFFKLVVDELLSNKGAIIISSANCVAESVNEDHSTYTILFSKTDRDGNSVNNPWKVGDHALCLTFQGEGVGTFTNVRNRYYWRKVVSIYTGDTYHSISLSKTDGEGSTVPAAGDSIVQLGYSGQEEIPSRQTAIILSSYPTMDTEVTPPSLAFYKGINDFALSSHRYTYMDGVNNEFFGNFKVLASGNYTDLTTILATMDGVISTVSKTVRGKNIISSDGWTDFNGNLLGADNYNEATQMLTNGSTHKDVVWSPIFFLPAGTYTFSCYSSSSDIELYVYDSNKRKDVPNSFNDSTSYYINNSRSGDSYQEVGRKYVSFTLDNDAYVCLNLYIDDSQFTVYRPMLESGSSVSDWESGVVTKTSQIKQTADSIDLGVRSDLGTVGININGDNKTVNLIAGKVNFVDPSGNAYAVPKISIDPTTGTLKAVDGQFEGTVKANNLYHGVCHFYKQDGSAAVYVNDDEELYYYIQRSSHSRDDGEPYEHFVDGHYYTSGQIKELSNNRLSEDSDGFIANTGNADVVMCMPDANNWHVDNDYVNLPDPEQFPGKIVEISAFSYGTESSTLAIRCVRSDYNYDNRIVGLVRIDSSGNIINAVPVVEKAWISTGGVARFVSVEALIAGTAKWVWVLLANQTGGDVYIGGGQGSGTVTSVGLVMPSGTFNVSNTPITSDGNLTVTFANQNANLVFASPNESTGTPSWRSLVSGDIPSLATSKITSGTFDAARIPNLSWNKITSDKPTTLAGYGITDAKIDGGVITLGGNTITPITQHQSLSGYLPLSGGTMTGTIIMPADEDYGIMPETDDYGFIGDEEHRFWQMHVNVATIDELNLFTDYYENRVQYGQMTSALFYLYPKSDSGYKFQVEDNGYVTAQKFVKDGGTSSQFLKANGDVDSSVYLTGVTLNSNALTVTNNTVNIPIAGANTPGVVQIGTGLTTNQDHLEVDTTVIATQSWVNSQGHVASAGVLKYSGTAKVSAQNDGALVDGYLHIGNVSVAEGGSFTYYPTITFGDYNGMDVYIQEDSEDHMTIRASAGITLLDATTINDSLHFSPTVSGYDCQVGMYLSSTLFNFVSINGQQSISGYKFDAEVQAPSFKKTGSSNDYVLLGGGGTKEVIDFATWMDRPVTARGLNVAGDSTLAAPHVRMTYDYVSAGRFSMNFTGYAGDTMVAPISYIFDAPVTQSSDIRMKDIIRDKAFDAESIAKMPLVTYSWKNDEEKREHFGTIAQNWEKVIPEVVIEGGDGMKTMDYGAAAMAAGVTACREVVALKKEIEELKEIIRELKNNK